MQRIPWACLVVGVLALAFDTARGDEGTGTLIVSVRGPDGAPVAGAVAWAWNEEGHEWRGTTDGTGVARVAGVAAGTVVLSVQAERFVGHQQSEVEVEVGKESKVDVSLEPGVPFDGMVVDATGAPVPGALIRVDAGGTFEGYMEGFPNHAPYAYTRTDEKGRFHVPGIPPDGVATVVVRAQGFQSASVAVRGFGETVRPANLVLRLEPGCSVSGVVTDPDGKAHPGATVLVIPADDEELRKTPHVFHTSDEGGMVQAATTRSDERGHYILHGLGIDREILVAAEADGFARSAWVGPLKPTAERREVRADLALHRAATLVIKLTGPDGKPRDGDRVQIDGPMSEFKAESAGTGMYRVSGLTPGEHAVRVEAKGFLPISRKVTTPEGKTVDLELALDAGAAISGVVVDATGKPVGGVTVRAERKEEDEQGWHDVMGTPADADTEGRFTIGGLRPGRHELSLWAPSVELEKPVELKAPVSGVRLVASRLGHVRLRLATSHGEPLPDTVYVWRHDRDGGGGGSGYKHKDGVLDFWIRKGPERININVDGYVGIVREVSAARGEEVDLGTIVLDPGFTLRGKVVDPQGKPIPAAIVSHEGPTEATTDADGRFALEHLPKGRIAIDLEAEGFLDGHVQADASAKEEPVVTLYRGSLLEGVLRDAAGVPQGDREIEIQKPGPNAGAPWEKVDDLALRQSGAFRVRLPAGRYRFTVREEGKDPAVLAEIEAVEGDNLHVDLVLGK